MNNIKKIAVATAVLCASFAAQAQEMQEINPSWYIQPSIMAMKPDSDFVVDKTGYGAGLKFGKALNEKWDMQFGYTNARSRDNGQRYQQETLGLDALYMFSRKSFRPFVLVGIGAQRDKADYAQFVQARKTSPYVSVGAGFQSQISDRVSFQADVRDVHGFIREDAFPNSKSDNLYVTLGFNFAFDKPPVAAAPVMTPPPPPPEPMVAAPPPPPPAPARFEKITLSSTELFSFDSAKLNDSQPKLDEIAAVLNSAPDVNDITISGYADRIGSEKYNQKLSEERANSVKAYLVAKGISAGRLNAVGKGESNPVVECTDKKMKRPALIKCLEPNRRVEVEQITIERKVQ